MTLKVRHFRNTDAAAICEVWNAHHELLGPSLPITQMHLEIFVLAKQYFEAANLVVAETDNGIEGFLQLSPMASAELEELNESGMAISAICVRPCEQEDEIARLLLEAAITKVQSQARSFCDFKPLLPNAAFFLGLGTGDSITGLTALENRTQQWLQESGFAPTEPSSLWELELASFQAPVDRQLIQIRRAAQVARQVDEPELPWWQACVLGHTEPSAFHLLHKKEGRLLSKVLFWTLAPELMTSPESIAWLWPPTAGQETEQNAELLFLLCEAIRELQSERVDTIRCVSSAQDNELNEILRRAGFRSSMTGMHFRKSF